jgi:hypothetical protein
VFDGNQLALFVDGERVATKACEGKRKTNELPLYLGADPDNSGEPTRSFIGQLDEFRLSKVARYQENFTPARRHQPDPETVLLHHFDQVVGPFVLDHSSSAANGQLGPDSRLVPVR